MKQTFTKPLLRAVSLLLCLLLTVQFFPPAFAADPEEDPIRDKGFLQPITQKTEVPEGWTGIYTAKDLTGLFVPSDSYILMNDIVLDDLTPLLSGKAFTGEFDGNGHTITYTMNVDVAGQDVCVGLFALLAGTVRNLHVAGSIRIAYSQTKAVRVAFGGVAGEMAKGSIDNCVSSVVVVENITKFFVTGEGGGIVGKISGGSTVSHCCNRGDLCGRLEIGGIVGSVSSDSAVEIYACLNQGKISDYPDEKGTGVAYGTDYMGGILGSSGYGTPLTLHECANLATIVDGDFLGGIIGQGQKGAVVTNCLNVGAVTAPAVMGGGIVGSAYACSVNKCINVGPVTGTRCGAIAGQRSSSPKLEQYYWSSESCACSMANTAELVGAVEPENLLKEDSYPPLDFKQIWEMNEDLGCPYPRALCWQAYQNAYKLKTEQHENNRVEQYYALLSLIDSAGGPNGGAASVLHKTYRESAAYYANREWSFLGKVTNALSLNFNVENPFDVLLADMFNQTYGQDCYEEAMYENVLSQTSDLFSSFDLLDVCREDEIQDILTELSKFDGHWYGNTAKQMKKLFGLINDTKAGAIAKSGIEIAGPIVSFGSNTASSAESLKRHATQFILYNSQSEAAHSLSTILSETATFLPMTATGTEKERAWCAKSLQNAGAELEKAAKGDCTGLYETVGGDVLQLFTTNGATAVQTVYKGGLFSATSMLGAIMLGLQVGKPVADAVTNMDDISYYSGMMDCAGLMSAGLYITVQQRLTDYHKDDSYHNLTRLKDALGMYFSLQMMACDYAIDWYGAINKRAWFENDDFYGRIADTACLQAYKAQLETLLKKSRQILLEPDTMNGYLINCPVTVHVEAADGTSLAVQSTGKQSIFPGLEGYYTLLGEQRESKLGAYSGAQTMYVEGDGTGQMDVIIWHENGAHFIGYERYEALPVTPGCRYDFTDDHAVLDNKTNFEPTERVYNPFVDVQSGAFYYDPVLWAVNHIPQITNGTDATHFSPSDTCTRGQVVTFLWRAANCPEPTGKRNPFRDVKTSDYFYKAVLWAVEQGITMGTGDDTFSPGQGCTRGQVVTFLHRFAKTPAPNTTASAFTDVKPDAFYAAAVLWAVEAGITLGTSDTTFSPNDTCTRAQIVTFLYRAMAK